MSATIYQFVPKPNPNRQKELDRQAVEIANMAFPNVLEAHYPDTTQANAFHAPKDDPA